MPALPDAPVCANFSQSRIPISDQPQANVGAAVARRRRPVDSSDKIVVEEGGSNRQLSSLQGKEPVVVPRRLAGYGKSDWVRSSYAGIGTSRLSKVGREFGTEQARQRVYGLEHPTSSKDLAAIVAGHSRRSNRAGEFVRVQNGRRTDIRAAVGEEYGAFRILWELGEESVSDFDSLVRLPPNAEPLASRAARHANHGTCRQTNSTESSRVAPSTKP